MESGAGTESDKILVQRFIWLIICYKINKKYY